MPIGNLLDPKPGLGTESRLGTSGRSEIGGGNAGGVGVLLPPSSPPGEATLDFSQAPNSMNLSV